MSGSGNRAGKLRQVRIIGGRWRGRKLAFSPADGLRPTGDRIRETLFNWLAPHIQDARCADLFAGSGALGMEALSRGAGYCDFVDSGTAVMSLIRRQLETLGAQEQGGCHAVTAQQFLAQSDTPYDIVFIDPPFNRQLVEPICASLARRGLLAPAALIYVETAASEPLPDLPAGWSLHREKVSGGVAYRLFRNAPAWSR